MKKWNWIWIGLLILVGAYLLFALFSCIVPPLFQKKTTVPRGTLPISQCQTERVHCIDDNREALWRRLQVIGAAKERLIFATFNFQDDDSGRDILSALQNAADRGVEVRMVVDGVSGFLHARNSQNFRTLASHPNVEFRIYNPVRFRKPWKLNYRMHDKYIVADDTVYLLGGRNTKNLSLGDYAEEKDFDRDLLVWHGKSENRGSLGQVQDYFENIWALPDTVPFTKAPKNYEATAQALRDHYEAMKQRLPEGFLEPDWEKETHPTNGIRLLHNPPEAANKAPTMWAHMMNLLDHGQDILIQTPYLICNGRMYDGIRQFTARGKDVRVLTNAVESGANLFGCVDYLNQKPKILKTGAGIYEYLGDHSSHCKTVMVDDRWSLVGSYNFDMRSTYLDTELMLAVDSPALNRELRQKAEQAMERSRYVEPDGRVTFGEAYRAQKLPLGKTILYTVLRVVVLPIRHLL